MASVFDQTLDDVWSRFDYGAALADLNPRITTHRIYCRCPQCNEPSGWVLPGQKEINCNRENHCGKRTNIFARLIGKTQTGHLDGDEFKRALKEACRLTGVPFPDSHEQTEHAKRNRQHKDAVAAVWEATREAMQSIDPFDPNPGVLHLLDRGFNLGFIASNFGYLDQPDRLLSIVDRQLLQSVGIVDINGSPLESWRFRIIIPAKDASGKLVGFIGRTVDPDCPPGEKYRYATGYAPAKFGGFGLDTAKTFPRIGIVEGILDVLKARQEGIDNLVAAGTNNFGVDNLLALSNFGVREVVAALDNDSAGNKGVWSILNAADESGDCPEVFAFTDWRGTKDPDEFIGKYGAAEFRTVFDSAIHGHRYRAREWCRQYDFAKDGQLTAFVEQCAAYGQGFNSARTRLRLNTYFLPEVAELAGVDLDDIKTIAKEAQLRADQEKRRIEFIARLPDAANLANSGDLSAAAELAGELSKALQGSANAVYVSPVPQGPEILDDVEATLRKYAERKFIGLPCGTLPTLDRLLHGLRGFILLAGGTNVGKTLLLGQLALSVVAENADACVLFLSAEMSRRTILQRMWDYLAGVSFIQHVDAYRNGAAPDAQEQIWNSRALFDASYRRFIRVWHPRIDGNPATEATIRNEVIDLLRTTGRSRCMLVVDYIDVLPVPTGLERATQQEREKAWCDQMINLKSVIGEDNPIIAVSTMAKRKGENRQASYDTEDMMGSAHKGYSSDIDILWNRWSDRQLLETYEGLPNGDFLRRRAEGVDFTEGQMRKRETREELHQIKEYFSKRGISLSRLEITKVRDGGTKGEIDIIVDYRRNRIREGVYL